MQQKELFERYEATLDKELAAILRECEHYAGTDHRYELNTMCEEIKSVNARTFVNFFDSLEESDGASGLSADFFASLADAANSAALPRLKSVLLDAIHQQFSRRI